MILRGILKILGFALFKLGFWGSAVFAAVYGGLCLWGGLTFNGYWFGAGLLASWVLGLTVSLAAARARYKSPVDASSEKMEPAGRDVGAVAKADVTMKREPEPAATEEKTVPQGFRPLTEAERAEYDKKYLSDYKPSVGKAAPTEAEKLYNSEKERLWKRLEEGRANEKPRVFATRKDPDIYIYEYSDRLQFYRKAGDEMILLSTEYKENKEYKKD